MMIFMIIMVNNTDSGIIIRGLYSLLALLYSIRGLYQDYTLHATSIRFATKFHPGQKLGLHTYLI